MEDNIIKVDYTEEMEQSYIDYAMSVIIQRAIPDIRDGLKPVHRRILYAMHELNLGHDKPFKKSARITGDVLGKYHPHGDSSVYQAMVRLAQDFNINHPLVEGQGNFGSIDGDPAAAMRYTEARLDELSDYLLQGLDKDIIDFIPNFDDSMKEPEVLPSKFFNLLVNGSTGIAVGMATNIPPHNLNEVINASKAYLKNEDITSRGLLRYISGPDFPTGGTIINKDDIKEIYETGNGRIRIRGSFEIEDLQEGRKNFVITEIPYTFAGNKTRLLENFIDLIEDGKLDEVVNITDESSKDGIRIVLEIKRGVDVRNFENKLYTISRFEDTVPVNMLSIVNGKPEILPLRDMMEEYIKFLKEIYTKEIKYDLDKLENLKEINEGFLHASDHIDLIIEIIRNSKNRDNVLKCLVHGETKYIELDDKDTLKAAGKLEFTQKQAEAVLRMQLQSLVGLEVDKIQEELDETNKSIKRSRGLLDNSDNLKDFIIEELDEFKKKFGRNRKTRIDQIDAADYEEEVIVEQLYALLDEFNYLKIIDNQSYSRTNPETLEEYRFIIPIKSNDSLCIFDDDTNFNQYKMEDLPISKMADRGKPLPSDMNILFADSWENIKDEELLFATRNSFVKRVDGIEFDTNRRQLIGTRVADDDKLIGVALVTFDIKEVILTTNDKRQLRFPIDEVSKFKRNAMGVTGMNLNQGDYVVRLDVDTQTDKVKRNRGAKGTVID